MKPRTKILLSSILAIFILLGFALPINPPTGNWYQQFMPQTHGSIRDIHFVDSLTGFAVSDSTILKTVNGGDNWVIKLNPDLYIFDKIQFLNKDTGFACAGNNKILRTTNSGENWTVMIPDLLVYPLDMWVINIDTILAVSTSAAGGVFRTTNGGTHWTYQAGFPDNPDHIYMYNSRIGFVGKAWFYPSMHKTTDGGQSWFALNDTGFTDMYFKDSLTGWKVQSYIKKTSDGGLNWYRQTLPYGGNIITPYARKIAYVNEDTLWANGGEILWNGTQSRDILFRTTNGGQNWLFQVPDTSLQYCNISHITFVNNNNGWAYALLPIGVHTTTGGDTVFYTAIQKISNEIPNDIKLFQNYPNPFNPSTVIRFQVTGNKYVKLVVYDILGRSITTLVNQKQSSGTYEVSFNGSNLSTGLYFYSLYIDEQRIDTKKMLLIK